MYEIQPALLPAKHSGIIWNNTRIFLDRLVHIFWCILHLYEGTRGDGGMHVDVITKAT